MMLLRANALCVGISGVRPVLVEMLVEMLNKGVTPVIPQKGSLGASGDLAPLSHMGLGLLGRGEALYQGERCPGRGHGKAGIDTLDHPGQQGGPGHHQRHLRHDQRRRAEPLRYHPRRPAGRRDRLPDL